MNLYSCENLNFVREVQFHLPSALRLSDLAFLLLAASALCAAASNFCFSRISFSLVFRAAAPRSLEPFFPVTVDLSAGSGLPLFFDEASELLVLVRCRLAIGRRLRSDQQKHICLGHLTYSSPSSLLLLPRESCALLSSIALRSISSSS